MPDPFEQYRAEFLFQLLNGFAYRGLGEVKGFCRAGKTALTDDFDKCAKGAEFHIYSLLE
ncbi:MAG TPA: hypothetical protein VF503_28025 [Sphingobium sp.]